jgi:hypothetical protein
MRDHFSGVEERGEGKQCSEDAGGGLATLLGQFFRVFLKDFLSMVFFMVFSFRRKISH